MLMNSGEIVGVYLAFYSERMISGHAERFCNLAAFCVREPFRAHGLRLVRALLRQSGFHFTDLSPSGNVVGLNERLGFVHLNTAAVLRANPPLVRRRGVRVISEPGAVARGLSGRDLQLFLDHRGAAAAWHVLITEGEKSCYVILRRDRRKRLPVFASVLHVSNADVLRRCLRPFLSHLLWHHRVLFTFLEIRVVGFSPRGQPFRRPRPRMYKSGSLGDQDIDYLYSELTCVAW